MNRLSKMFLGLFLICFFVNINAKEESSNNVVGQKKGQIIQNKDPQVADAQLKKDETLEEFLQRAIKAAKSEDENDLKSIIVFPLKGYAETYKTTYETYEDLKRDGRIYYFFKEDIALSTEIKRDSETITELIGEGTDKYRWYFFRYLEDSYVFFKLEKFNGKYKIIGVCVPGY